MEPIASAWANQAATGAKGVVGVEAALPSIVFVALLLFVPFYWKRQRLTSLVYLLFVCASSLLHGAPVESWWAASWLAVDPAPAISHITHYVFLALAICGSGLILAAWARIYRDGGSELVEDGIYGAIRHPQYAGFLLVTLGMLIAGPTTVTAILWLVLAALYVRLARTEEHELARRSYGRWQAYRARVGMFLPRIRL